MLVVYADGPAGGTTTQTDARLLQQDRVVLSRIQRTELPLLGASSARVGLKPGHVTHLEYRIARRYANVVILEFVRELGVDGMAVVERLPIANETQL